MWARGFIWERTSCGELLAMLVDGTFKFGEGDMKGRNMIH
jgi:hypothetical protein